MSDDVPFPPERIEQYRRDGLWTGETLGDALRRAARAHPDRAALITVDTRLTHAELDELSESFAAGLLATTPLCTGDRVLFQLGNEAETVVAYYGCVKAGIVPVCTLPQHGEREIGQLAEHTGARGHLVQADFPQPRPGRPRDPAPARGRGPGDADRRARHRAGRRAHLRRDPRPRACTAGPRSARRRHRRSGRRRRAPAVRRHDGPAQGRTPPTRGVRLQRTGLGGGAGPDRADRPPAPPSDHAQRGDRRRAAARAPRRRRLRDRAERRSRSGAGADRPRAGQRPPRSSRPRWRSACWSTRKPGTPT